MSDMITVIFPQGSRKQVIAGHMDELIKELENLSNDDTETDDEYRQWADDLKQTLVDKSQELRDLHRTRILQGLQGLLPTDGE